MRFKLNIENKDPEIKGVSMMDRRGFLKMGFLITGTLAGGTILQLTSAVEKTYASAKEFTEKYPYKPHYAMVFRIDRCIGCERCVEACAKTNQVPSYGYRTRVLEREFPDGIDKKREFLDVMCNQCNNPPCVTGCPTKATYKDKTNGIVMMKYEKCIGCKTCMVGCPYNARYFNDERKSVDKCNFCYDTRLSKGLTTTACMEACPAGCRIFGDLSNPKDQVYQMVHQVERAVWVLRPETGAKPNVFYTRG